jgi:hypothetical protein
MMNIAVGFMNIAVGFVLMSILAGAYWAILNAGAPKSAGFSRAICGIPAQFCFGNKGPARRMTLAPPEMLPWRYQCSVSTASATCIASRRARIRPRASISLSRSAMI